MGNSGKRHWLAMAACLGVLVAPSGFAFAQNQSGYQNPANVQTQGRPGQAAQLTPAQRQALLQQQQQYAQQQRLAQQQRMAQQQNVAPNNTALNNTAQQNMGARQGAVTPGNARPSGPPQVEQKQPFPPLTPEQQARLDQILLQWQNQTQGTKTLSCNFSRWHYDQFAAPHGVFATKSQGIIRYASPDKGLFRVESKEFFTGMEKDKPQYTTQKGKYGEWWVCTGKELLEYDRNKSECRIQVLPEELQGTQIFNSPLPFVFNSDAQQIKQKFWVCEGPAPDENTILINAWPKTQENRAQYRFVQIALSRDFLPKALVMFAPNFHPQTNKVFDQYEFSDIKRNTIGAGLSQFMNFFIPQKPPSSWKVLRDNFLVGPQQVAGGEPANAKR